MCVCVFCVCVCVLVILPFCIGPARLPQRPLKCASPGESKRSAVPPDLQISLPAAQSQGHNLHPQHVRAHTIHSSGVAGGYLQHIRKLQNSSVSLVLRCDSLHNPPIIFPIHCIPDTVAMNCRSTSPHLFLESSRPSSGLLWRHSICSKYSR